VRKELFLSSVAVVVFGVRFSSSRLKDLLKTQNATMNIDPNIISSYLVTQKTNNKITPIKQTHAKNKTQKSTTRIRKRFGGTRQRLYQSVSISLKPKKKTHSLSICFNFLFWILEQAEVKRLYRKGMILGF
jgi:hypothetical protein